MTTAALQFVLELRVKEAAKDAGEVAKAASVALRDVPVSCNSSTYGVPAVTVPEYVAGNPAAANTNSLVWVVGAVAAVLTVVPLPWPLAVWSRGLTMLKPLYSNSDNQGWLLVPENDAVSVFGPPRMFFA